MRRDQRVRRSVIAIAAGVATLVMAAGCTDPPASTPGDWTLLGGPVLASTDSASSITRIDASGAAVVATAVTGATTARITVSAWRAGTWSQLGGPLNTTPSGFLTGMELDPGGNPSVTWTEGGSGYVSHWDGTAWQPVGSPIPNIVNEDLFIASGWPLTVGYYQLNGPVPAGRQLVIATWTGTAWSALAPHVLPNYTVAFPVAVALNGATPVVAWQGLQPNGFAWDEVVEQYDNAKWTGLGTVVSTSGTVGLNTLSLAAGDGLIALGWTQSSPLRTPQGTKTIVDSYVDQWTGAGWQTLGGDLGPSTIGALIEGAGHLVAAVTATSEVTVQTWNGLTWVPIGGLADVGEGVGSQLVSLSQSVGAFALSWTSISHPDSSTFGNQIRVSKINLS